MKEPINIVNRKVKYEYEFLDTYEAGVVLTGAEVYAIRKGKLSFVDSYCMFLDGELFMKNVSIAGIGNDNIKRDRKLLLKKQELVKIQKSLVKGLTIVPYKMYQKKNILKVEIVLARGKNLHDKRESIKERDIKKEVNRILK